MPNRLCTSLLLLATAAPAQENSSPLSGRQKTVRFEILFRPGSRAEAAVDRIAALVERDLGHILWVDGVLVLEAPMDGAPARLGVGGKARARDLRVRKL